MGKIYFYFSCFCAGFSIGGLIASIGKNNEVINYLRLIILGNYIAIPIIYLILILISYKWKLEELKLKLISILSKEYIAHYLTALIFLIALLIYQKANTITLYG